MFSSFWKKKKSSNFTVWNKRLRKSALVCSSRITVVFEPQRIGAWTSRPAESEFTNWIYGFVVFISTLTHSLKHNFWLERTLISQSTSVTSSCKGWAVCVFFDWKFGKVVIFNIVSNRNTFYLWMYKKTNNATKHNGKNYNSVVSVYVR